MGNVVAHYGDRSAHQVLTMEQMRELADLHPPVSSRPVDSGPGGAWLLTASHSQVLGQSKFLSRMTEMLHQVTCGHSREPSLQVEAFHPDPCCAALRTCHAMM